LKEETTEIQIAGDGTEKSQLQSSQGKKKKKANPTRSSSRWRDASAAPVLRGEGGSKNRHPTAWIKRKHNAKKGPNAENEETMKEGQGVQASRGGGVSRTRKSSNRRWGESQASERQRDEKPDFANQIARPHLVDDQEIGGLRTEGDGWQ